MSQAHRLSDQQVEQELRKMTAFIRQEAMEKAHEIEIKANEEFAIERSKLVRQETDGIDGQYEKKFKQATMSQQITRSTVANKTRLRVLAARQSLIDDIFAAAERRLREGSDNPERYQALLQALVLEGLYAMAEPAVKIRARPADRDAVTRAIEAAVAEYKDKTGRETRATVDESNPLPDESAGGVVILSSDGRIDINNTFEARLGLLQETALPAMRETLFGKNPNRKFFD